MKNIFILFLSLIFVGCGFPRSFGTHPTPQKDSLIERSAEIRPIWITKIPKGTNSKYFLGEGQGIKEKEAYESAIADMLKRYAEYIGTEIKILTQIHEREIKRIRDEVYEKDRKVITEIEALSKVISVGSEIRERYWEKWAKISGNTIEYIYYKYWVLGEVENKFIEEEQKRIKRYGDIEKLPEEILPNSDLTVEITSDREKYKAGDTVRIIFSASDSCYAYLLNFYGEGESETLASVKLEKNIPHIAYGLAKYCGKSEERIMVFVSDKPLDIKKALEGIYPLAIIENLLDQTKTLKARYAGKILTIFIVPK